MEIRERRVKDDSEDSGPGDLKKKVMFGKQRYN